MSITSETKSQRQRRWPVLIFQDNPAQWLTIRLALEQSLPEVEPILMTSLITASTYLNTIFIVPRAIPRLIFIDISLSSREEGLALLVQLKADSRFENTPVIILNDSETPEDVLQAYTMGAACYITKPLNYADWLVCFYHFKSLWLQLAKLPVSK